MAEATARSPKRRRTDPAPVPTSQDQIVQTNATLNHFTGQRHNRWMQRHVPPIGEEEGGGTNATSPSEHRETGRGSAVTSGLRGATSAVPTSCPGSVHNRSTSSTGASDAPSGASRQVRGIAEARAKAASPVGPAARAGIVNYESPYTSASTRSTGTTSMYGMVNTSNNAVPGLPSPAPSDENTNSPVIGGSGLTSTANMAEMAQQSLKRRPQPENPVDIITSNRSSVHPAPNHQHTAFPTPRFEGAVRLPGAAGSWSAYQPLAPTHQRTPDSHGHGSNVVAQAQTQSAPLSTAAQQEAAALNRFAPNVLRARVQVFEQCRPKGQACTVDDGRLALLRDAVSTQVDWFYVALSQIHALTEQQRELPEAIRSLPKKCWKYVDDLLCSNKMVSPPLLEWLADFPAPVTSLYTDKTISSLYSTYVDAVAGFLRDLPAKWDGLVQHCRRLQAPPLTQDLALGLGLGSPVLQSVAFRAITRMIYNSPDDGKVLDHLELLHRYDQHSYGRRLLRTPGQKTVAYQAFQTVRAEWTRYLHLLREHELRQQNLPTMSRTVYPHFNVGFHCRGALTVFQSRQGPAQPVPSNAPFVPQQQARTPLQQQQAMIANEQRLVQAPPPVRERSHTQSPAQVNMTQRAPHGGHFLASMPPQRNQPGSRLMFPHETEGPRSQPTEPNPTRSALHQAHLRSPVSVPLQTGPEMPQLYRYVCQYALSPTTLDKNKPINMITFDLAREDFNKIPKTQASNNPGDLPNRILSEGCQTYRLRCCAIKSKGFPSESEWVVADTHWPDTLYLELNGQMLDMRRPLHHKKYLPVDLTNMVKSGTNEIKAVINRMSTDKRPFDFALTVETVGVLAHSTLVSKLDSEQSISAADTKASIQKALSGVEEGNDDADIAITSTSMTIKLFDPFSGSRIFSTPVRGMNCPHKDCFDLDIFLAQCKREKPGYPSIVDCWRCPLCRGDVRPNMLVRDEWLVEVRKTLEKGGKLDTRAIVVEADASWKTKPEEKTGVRSASLEREERGGSAAKKTKSAEGTPAPRRVVEVIELD